MKRIRRDNHISLISLGNIIILNISRYLRFNPAPTKSAGIHGRQRQAYGDFMMQHMSGRSLFK